LQPIDKPKDYEMLPSIVRDMDIDDIASVYHLGETLFTSDLYPYIYRTWDQWEVIGLYNLVD